MKWTTVEALAGEWKSEAKFSSQQEEDILRRWIHNATEKLIGTQTQVFQLAFLSVEHGEAALPVGLDKIYLAACVSDRSKWWNRMGMKSWVDKSFGENCELEVNLKCDRCHKEECTCSTPVLEFEIDQLYREENPWIWHSAFHHFAEYSAPVMDGFPCSNMNPEFQIMKPRVSNDAFWNTEHYLGVCSKLGDVNTYTFTVEDKFITDLAEGQVLISYLAYKMDGNGYYMIPDRTEVVEAIGAYITERLMHRKWMMGNGNQNDRLRWRDAIQMKEVAMAQARSLLESPDVDQWERLVHRHVNINRDRYHYGL